MNAIPPITTQPVRRSRLARRPASPSGSPRPELTNGERPMIAAKIIQTSLCRSAQPSVIWLHPESIAPEFPKVRRGFLLTNGVHFAPVVIKCFASAASGTFQKERDHLLHLRGIQSSYRFVELLDYGILQPKGRPRYSFLAMKEAPGSTLREILTGKGVLSPLEMDLKTFSFRLLDYLRTLHNHDMLHMDLKPENLCIDCDGSLTAIDFGASILRGRFTGEIQLTLEISPPEVLAVLKLVRSLSAFCDTAEDAVYVGHRIARFQEFWRRCIGPWCDLYSAGILIDSLLRPAYEAGQAIPPEIIHLICTLTQSDYRRRPPHAQAALDILSDWR